MAWVKSPTEVLRDVGIAKPEDINLELIAFTLNAEVVYEPLDGYEANIFGANDKAVITINRHSIQARQRFSLAHELGHWTNDRGKNLSIECSTGDMQQKEGTNSSLSARQAREARANVFASQLLMPGYMMDADFVNMPINIDTVRAIANTFGTSLTSAASRLIQITKLPAMIIFWRRDGSRRWFDRSSSLSPHIWPVQHIASPSQQLIQGNNSLVNDKKWLDPRSAKGIDLIECTHDNGFDLIVLLSWS